MGFSPRYGARRGTFASRSEDPSHSHGYHLGCVARYPFATPSVRERGANGVPPAAMAILAAYKVCRNRDNAPLPFPQSAETREDARSIASRME